MTVFINEFHYDNAGGDVGEFIEVAGTAGTDLTGYTIVFYNGSVPGAAVTYRTLTLTGTIDDEGSGFGAVSFALPVDGIQNGANDGFALVAPDGTVLQLLSYEGVFTASNGPAAGMTSTDIGVAETGTTPIGQSLQLTGTGTGAGDFVWLAPSVASAGTLNNGQIFAGGGGNPGVLSIADASAAEGNAGTTTLAFTVTRAGGSTGAVATDYTITLGTADAADFGAGTVFSGTVAFDDGATTATIEVQIAGDTVVEPDEMFTITLSNPIGGVTIDDGVATGTITNDDAAPAGPANVFINEIHYDNSGADVGEAVEVAGTAGTNLTGWTLVFYNGNGGASYGTVALSGTIPDQDDGFGTLSFLTPGLQNGAPDGIALVNASGAVVQFLSYEGSFTATNGPAAGLVSTDIGVAEEPAPGVGFSLQLTGTGSAAGDFTWVAARDDNFGSVNTDQDFLSPNAPGQLRVGDASVVEGDAGTQSLVFTVRRAGGSAQTATVDYTINLDGTANAADLGAGAVLSGTLTFAPGVTSIDVIVPVNGDVMPEGNETLSLTLSNPGNASIIDGDATGTIINDDPVALAIYQIQGESHQSAFVGQTVTTSGIVTAVDTNGFYLQDATGDGNARTSDAIFVFTNTAPTVAIGDAVLARGTVAEFLPGNNTDNLTATQLNSTSVTVQSSGNALPAAVLIGTGGVLPPSEVFDNDGFAIFDPENDAADFFESLEGMRVTIDAPLVTSPTNGFGETFVVASGGAGATGVNARGGITISGDAVGNDDYNPERIQLDDDTGLFAGFTPNYGQGDILSSVTGIVSYNFQTYEVLVTEAVTITIDAPAPTREVTNLVGSAERLTIASYNVENLDSSDNKFDLLAGDIVFNLRAPDIIGLQEIQDADGAGSGSDLSGFVTAQGLIDAIAAIGGPNYVYIEFTPLTPNSTGGEPNGNIRNGFLYNPDRVDYVAGSGEPVPGAAFNNSRQPFAATFLFNGEAVTAISVHSTSRGGSDPLFGATQPPANAGEGARIAQSQAIRDYVDGLLAIDADTNIVVLGDFNGFYFEESLELLETGGVLSNLLRLLPEEERYSFVFEGNAQALDNLLVSADLLGGAQFDIVHINSEQPDTAARGTDHEALLASLFIPQANGAPVAANDSVSVNEDGTTANLRDLLLGNDSDPDAGDTLRITAVDDSAALGTVIFDPTTQSVRYVADNDAFDALAPGQTATDSFTYTIADDGGRTSTATVTVTITGIADGVVRFGTLMADTLTGTNDEDTLFGSAGNDTLNGLGANDVLFGGNGNDTIFGGAGDDRIAGERGNDTMTGGMGADAFIFERTAGTDIITDFDVVRDVIVLERGTDIGSSSVADTNNDGIADLTLNFTLGGKVTLLGVSDFNAVNIERSGDLLLVDPMF